MLKDLQQIITGPCLFGEPMSRHTTYGIGGPADAFVAPQDIGELRTVLKFANERDISTTVIGSGSNLLVSDEGIRGIVIRLNGYFNDIQINGNLISTGCNVMLGKLVNTVSSLSLSGCESLVGIPGTVGGAIFMNAGAYKQEISVHLSSVDIMTLDGIKSTISAEDIAFGYRSSSLSRETILLKADFHFPTGDETKIQANMKSAREKRKSTQPLSMRSAGSVFKNPEKSAAGYLIDKAGLKGFTSGEAQISEKHANFFVNTGNAKATDILSLIQHVKSSVIDQFGIELELEIKLIGFEESSPVS